MIPIITMMAIKMRTIIIPAMMVYIAVPLESIGPTKITNSGYNFYIKLIVNIILENVNQRYGVSV